MVVYRRNRVEGGTYFFTVTLRDRQTSLLTKHVGLLRESVRKTRRARPFIIDAWVVLPEHMHAIWTLPTGDADYSTRWRSIKANFSHELGKVLENSKCTAKGEYGFWQRRFWEHTIRDEEDYVRHVDYLHYNPVKHGYVHRVTDWPYSSFHRFMANKTYPSDWGYFEENELDENDYGE